MATWDDILQVGKYGGVVFDFVSSRDAHSNTIDEQKFPNRPGQRNQPKARDGVRFDVLGIFIEDDYPSTMNALIAQLDDGGVPKELVHPVFGTLQASCANFVISHDVEDAADSATIQITFVEHTDGDALTQASTTAPAHANALRSGIADVLAALSAFQAATEVQNSDIGLQVVGAMNLAQSLADNFEADGDEISALELQAAANGALASIDVPVDALADYDSTEKYELAEALLAVAAEISAFTSDLIEAKPPLATFVVSADTNVLSWLHGFYVASGKADTVTEEMIDDFLALNSIPDPSLLPAGFQVNAYAA